MQGTSTHTQYTVRSGISLTSEESVKKSKWMGVGNGSDEEGVKRDKSGSGRGVLVVERKGGKGRRGRKKGSRKIKKGQGLRACVCV